MKIKEAVARKIYNSNGEEAIEVEIRSEKAVAKGSCDAGTSTGSHEVNAYPKEGVDFIVDKFNKNISWEWSKRMKNFANIDENLNSFKPEVDGSPLLLIDDECDHASIDTYKHYFICNFRNY